MWARALRSEMWGRRDPEWTAGDRSDDPSGAEEGMTRVGLLPALTLGVALLSEAAAAKPGFGVFATINGKKFRAPSSGRPDDRCVSGNYVASGGIVFSALECRGRGHRKRSRRNPKVLAFACGVVNPPDQPPPTPPFEAPCLAAGYSEFRSRHGIPVSMKQWL